MDLECMTEGAGEGSLGVLLRILMALIMDGPVDIVWDIERK